MSSELKQALYAVRTTESRITPDPAWVRSTRERVMRRAHVDMDARAVPSSLARFWSAPSAFFAFIRRPVMTISSFIVLILGGSIMSVSASERSLPGDFFYTIKLASEQARMAFASNKEDRLKLKAEFTSRRVSEFRRVVATSKEQPERVVQVAEILKQDMKTLKDQLNDATQDVTPDEAVAAAKIVDTKGNEVMLALQETRDQIPAETQEKVTDAQSAAADTSMKAIEVLATRHEEAAEAVSVEDVVLALQTHARVVGDVTSVNAAPLVVLSASFASSTSGVTTTEEGGSTMSASATSSVSSPLPQLVDQVKDATVQVFAEQKAQDHREAAEASGIAESTPSSTEELHPQATTTKDVVQSTTSTPERQADVDDLRLQIK